MSRFVAFLDSISNNNVFGKLTRRSKYRLAALNFNIYCCLRRDLQDVVISNLENQLRAHDTFEGRKVHLNKLTVPRNYRDGHPLIVVCMNASRIEADVQQALQGLSCTHTLSVVIIHNIEAHRLPIWNSASILVGWPYDNVGLIVDIAYTRSRGIYDCQQNDNSIGKLARFITRQN